MSVNYNRASLVGVSQVGTHTASVLAPTTRCDADFAKRPCPAPPATQPPRKAGDAAPFKRGFALKELGAADLSALAGASSWGYTWQTVPGSSGSASAPCTVRHTPRRTARLGAGVCAVSLQRSLCSMACVRGLGL